jgi:hypothetical protein
MSALPPKADMCSANADVRFGSKADICGAARHVRFTPNSDRESGRVRCKPSCLLWANSGHRADLSQCPPMADISLRRRRVSEHLLRPRSLGAPEAEVPLPPGPHLVASGEQRAHPEIQAHRDA